MFDNHRKHDSRSKCYYDVCPLVSQNFNSIWSVISWNFSADALCNLQPSSLFNDHKNEQQKKVVVDSSSPINIIVFGGSMTWGRDSLGTCCDPETKLCSSEANNEHSFKPLDTNKW